jgi:hypothetical protein
MSKQAPNIIDVLAKAVDHFKCADYEEVQNLFKGKEYSQAIDAVEDGELKTAIANLYEHMRIATSPNVLKRLNEGFLKKINDSISQFEKSSDPEHIKLLKYHNEDISSESILLGTVSKLAKGFHTVVHNISNSMEIQQNTLNKNESDLFNDKGWFGYAGDVASRRWNPDGIEEKIVEGVKIIVPEKKMSSPKTSMGGLIYKGSELFGNNNAAAEIPNNNITYVEKIVDVTLEKTALEEFGNVKLLDTPFNKCLAGAGVVAGVVFFGHGIRNIYLAFNPDENENIEVAELGHEKTKGINWVRAAVGAGEVAVGGTFALSQITGRNILHLGTAVKGDFSPLCDHGENLSVGRS